MRTWTGATAPIGDEGEVRLFDLAFQLGRTIRFGHAGGDEWSVLHHSLLVAMIWIKAGYPVEGLPYVLLHDAHEAYTGDVPAPIKRRMAELSSGTSPLASVEREIDERIRDALGLPRPSIQMLERVKICDLVALVAEAPLFGGPGARCLDCVPRGLMEEVLRVLQLAFPDLVESVKARGVDHGLGSTEGGATIFDITEGCR